jgi:hypothetical protein
MPALLERILDGYGDFKYRILAPFTSHPCIRRIGTDHNHVYTAGRD